MLNGNIREHDLSISTRKLLARYTVAILFVFATGIVAWFVSDPGQSDERPKHPKQAHEWQIQMIGWTSATLYRESPHLVLVSRESSLYFGCSGSSNPTDLSVHKLSLI